MVVVSEQSLPTAIRAPLVALRLALLAALLVLPGCNPFVPEKGGEGQPCLDDGTCQPGLVCVVNRCLSSGPDGGQDGGDGEPDPCLDPDLDCSAPDLDGQGQDRDQDGWGRCCDCDETDSQVNPSMTELTYNQKDDDCDPETLDDDLDQDSYSGADGTDCDDQNPDIHPGASEDCNGLDDDCDEQTDEDLNLGLCPLQDGVCAGTVRECLGVQGFGPCDYGPLFSESPETECDLRDNDCDGSTDEDGQQVLVAETGVAASDGVDNNCNGLVDEPGGVIVLVTNQGDVWMDSYEITVYDNPDCSGMRYGEQANDYPADWPATEEASLTLYACSVGGVVPSGFLSWHQATRACEAQGKRLCTRVEIMSACSAGTSFFFPYGPGFIPGVCNDPIGGSGQAAATGSYQDCTSDQATYDMSGNLAEWVEENPDQVGYPGMALLSSYGFSGLICSRGDYCQELDPDNTSDMGNIENLLNCIVGTGMIESFPKETQRDFIGARCCMDQP